MRIWLNGREKVYNCVRCENERAREGVAVITEEVRSGPHALEPEIINSDASPASASAASGIRDVNRRDRKLFWGLTAIFVILIGLILVASQMQRKESETSRKLREAGLSPDFCKQFPNAAPCPGSPQTTEQNRNSEAEITKEQTSQQPTANQSQPTTQPSPAISIPEKPPDPTVQEATQKVLREKWAEETQKDLWRQGMEMTFQARGTTLHVEYVLAGKAFAFEFGESFVAKNADTLRALGFKRVELLDGDSSNDLEADHRWRWNLTK